MRGTTIGPLGLEGVCEDRLSVSDPCDRRMGQFSIPASASAKGGTLDNQLRCKLDIYWDRLVGFRVMDDNGMLDRPAIRPAKSKSFHGVA